MDNLEDLEKILGSDDYSILLIFLAFMTLLIATSAGVLFIGQAYSNYVEGVHKKEVDDFRKKHNFDDLEKEMKPSQNALMDDSMDELNDTHDKVKLACLYSMDAPSPSIGSAMCMDRDTGYVYVTGGTFRELPSGIGRKHDSTPNSCDLHIYSSCEREWQHFKQNPDFGGGLNLSFFNLGCVFNQVVLFGGLDNKTGQIHNELYSFDMESSAWIELNVKNHNSETGSQDFTRNKPVKRPAPRYNSTMCRYKDSKFVIFGGKGRTASGRGTAVHSSVEDEGVVYIPRDIHYNDVWVLDVGHPEYVYFEELYGRRAESSLNVPQDLSRAKNSSTSTLEQYENACAAALGQASAPPKLTDSSGDSEITYNYPAGSATIVPLAREAHCAAIVGDNMIVFGGATVNTIYKSGDDVSSPNANDNSNSTSDVVTSTETAGIRTHEQGMVEIFDLDSCQWFIVNTCGEHPIGDLVGVSAHSLGDEANKVILFSANTMEPTRHSIFNAFYIMDIAVSNSVAATGEPKVSLLLTWTRFMYQWLGDWCVLPLSRVFYSAALDADEGLIYVFGGYNNYKDSVDITISNGEKDDRDISSSTKSFRNNVRMNRLSKLNRAPIKPNLSQSGVNGNLSKAEIVNDICVVDITAILTTDEDDSADMVRNTVDDNSDSISLQDVEEGSLLDDEVDTVLEDRFLHREVSTASKDKSKSRRLSRKNVPLGDLDEEYLDDLGNRIPPPVVPMNPEDVGKEFYLSDSDEEEDSDVCGTEHTGLKVKRKKLLTRKVGTGVKRHHGNKKPSNGAGSMNNASK